MSRAVRSGQERQERRGEQWPSGGGSGGLAGKRSCGSVVINRSPRRQDALTFRAHNVFYYLAKMREAQKVCNIKGIYTEISGGEVGRYL
jgi:hypothetical protein